jgi:hypothetical protein
MHRLSDLWETPKQRPTEAVEANKLSLELYNNSCDVRDTYDSSTKITVFCL